MEFKLYWSPSEAIIATVVATFFIGGLCYVHPGLHPLAYAAGWLVLAGIMYQTGCELSERTRNRKHSRADADNAS
jgi:hypothetical protein